MTRLRLTPPTVLTLLVLAACGGQEPPVEPGVVARAGDMRWTVEEAAAVVAADADTPTDPEVVGALAELWIDYALLAVAAAEDTTLAGVDVSPLVEDLVAEQLILALRDSVITIEPLAEDEIRRRFAEDAPNSLARARQIVLTWPDAATEAQRDSVRSQVAALRSRIAEGASFAEIATEYSQDRGTAAQGGAMGVVGRGALLDALTETLFSLEPGVVSDPVETPYGVHLLMVEEWLTPTEEQFRAQLARRRAAQAESTYIAGLEGAMGAQVAPDAVPRVRSLAQDYRTALTGSQAGRPLLMYRGGAVSEGEVLWYLQAQAPELRARIATDPDDAAALQALRAVTHRELLVAQALARGWSVPAGPRENIAAQARRNLLEAARQLGLAPLEPGQNQTVEDAAREAADRLLSDILTGERREVTPLGPMSYLLRLGHDARVFEANLGEAVQRIRELRGGAVPRDSTGG